MVAAILYILYAVIFGAITAGFWRLRQAKRRFRQVKQLTPAATVEMMPSISVCIPARNESHAMTDALHRVIASTYPKLEIIVLDDLSADKTPALIKAFAQDGVRFIEGGAVPEGWLGKNHALDTLLRQASGTYVLFLDVDTWLAPHSISQLLAYAQSESAAMVSVLPRREDGFRASTLFAPLRYFWELMFHRRQAPAVASNAWLVERQTLLDDFESLEKLKGVIQPEAHVAATYMAKGRYRFLIGNTELGISHEKKWRSQVDTSIRLLFPLLGARVSHAIIVALDLLVLASPAALVLYGAIWGWSVHLVGAVILYIFGALLYGAYLKLIWRHGWWAAPVWPYIVLQESILVVVSTVQYLRGRVRWKGRTVSINLPSRSLED